jgi:hypothetical protein
MPKTKVKCFLCDGPATDEDLCYGCKKIICSDCDSNPDVPFGGHAPEAHVEGDGEDYD